MWLILQAPSAIDMQLKVVSVIALVLAKARL